MAQKETNVVEAAENPNFLFLEAHCTSADIIALQGGTRSGKTYSVIRFLIWLCYYYSGLTISIVRKTFPALSASALRDFQEILRDAGLYDKQHESKPQGYYEYRLNGNLIEFFSLDNQQKVRGRKRDILYINEANELNLEEYRQLAFRTEGLKIMDYNPSEPESYIYDFILPRPNCQMLITTYKDNPFLSKAIVDEIEILEQADPEYWKVFGQGIRGKVSGIILAHYKVLEAANWPEGKGQKVYGVDFGYSAPSAIVEVTFYDNAHYLRQKIYQRKLTNPDLIAAIKADPTIDKSATFYCDSAEPDRIEEFKKAGLKAVKADKSIEDGLDAMRAKPLFIHEESVELIGEIKGYRYKKNPITGENTDEPIALADHAIDAGRYGVYTHQKKPVFSGPKITRPMRKKTTYFSQ